MGYYSEKGLSELTSREGSAFHTDTICIGSRRLVANWETRAARFWLIGSFHILVAEKMQAETVSFFINSRNFMGKLARQWSLNSFRYSEVTFVSVLFDNFHATVSSINIQVFCKK